MTRRRALFGAAGELAAIRRRVRHFWITCRWARGRDARGRPLPRGAMKRIRLTVVWPGQAEPMAWAHILADALEAVDTAGTTMVSEIEYLEPLERVGIVPEDRRELDAWERGEVER